MADTKITALTAITTVDPAVDVLPIVDVSDTTMAASGTTKKITSNQILGAGGTATLASATITGAATVGTTFGVTGASTFTGAATFNGAATLNGNTTLGDAQTDTSTINAQLTARQGEFPSAVRAAASDYAAVNFDGATAAQRITSTMTSQAFSGTGDFTIWSRFRVPVTNIGSNSIIVGLSDSNIAVSTANSFYILINTAGGELTVAKRSAANGFQNAFNVAGFSAAYAGQIVDLIVARVSGAWKCYINGTDVTPGTTNFAGETVSFTYCHVGLGGTAQTLNTQVFRSVVFNRALSAADVTELITTGVNPADQWGTQTGQTSGTLVASKRYRITTYVSADSFTNVGAASNTTGVEFVATGTTPTTWTNASTLNQIGGLVDLDFTVGTGYQATDRSTNSLHGTLFNGVEFTVPKKVAVVYATTATNGNQQMLGTLAIPTNAIIEDIIVNSTGSATVSVGNASAGTQIVNGASVVSGRQKLTIATPFSTTGNLWVNSNATATLQFTILYTIAS
jgi:hypothetical protein